MKYLPGPLARRDFESANRGLPVTLRRIKSKTQDGGQPRPQGSLLSCAGKIGTPGQSGFRTNSYWLLKDKSVTTGSPDNPQHG